VIQIKIVSIFTLPAVIRLVTERTEWIRAFNLAHAVNQTVSSIALKASISRTTNIAVRIVALQLAHIVNKLVALQTLFACITVFSTGSTARIPTAKNTDTFDGFVSPVTHTAEVLRIANIAVVIIANKLALTVHNFISFHANLANISIFRTTNITVRVSAIKIARITFLNKFKISDTEVPTVTSITIYNWFT
jgi:hypothetical protein